MQKWIGYLEYDPIEEPSGSPNGLTFSFEFHGADTVRGALDEVIRQASIRYGATVENCWLQVGVKLPEETYFYYESTWQVRHKKDMWRRWLRVHLNNPGLEAEKVDEVLNSIARTVYSLPDATYLVGDGVPDDQEIQDRGIWLLFLMSGYQIKEVA